MYGATEQRWYGTMVEARERALALQDGPARQSAPLDAAPKQALRAGGRVPTHKAPQPGEFDAAMRHAEKATRRRPASAAPPPSVTLDGVGSLRRMSLSSDPAERAAQLRKRQQALEKLHAATAAEIAQITRPQRATRTPSARELELRGLHERAQTVQASLSRAWSSSDLGSAGRAPVCYRRKALSPR